MNDDKLLRISAWLLVFSGILVVLGQLLAHTAIGQVTPFEELGTWVAVVGGGIALAAALTMIIASAGTAAVSGRQRTKATMNATAPAAKPQPVRQASARDLNYAELQW
jgi:hypothetical protein